MDIVLYEPEMPLNTGNIGRTCVATGTRLHLIEPLGFKLSDKAVKRAGLDYWDKLDMATTKARQAYTDVAYEPDCYLMFGSESAGIPEEILVRHQADCVRIPMWGDIRSLNLANSVAIVLYEALRQNGFEKMNCQGKLHKLEWGE